MLDEPEDNLKDALALFNPAWEYNFLRLLFQLLKFKKLPFVLILKADVWHRDYFSSVFGCTVVAKSVRGNMRRPAKRRK